jgi:hypothetical protein
MNELPRPDPGKRAQFISWNEYVAANPQYADLLEGDAAGRELRFMADYPNQERP